MINTSLSLTRRLPVLLSCAFLLAACATGNIPFNDPTGPLHGWLQLALALAGLLLLVAGFALHDVVLQVIGFIAGGLFGAYIGGMSGGEGIIVLIGFLAGGILGAILARALAYATVFVGGFAAGAVLSAAASSALANGDPNRMATLAGGFIGGLIMLGLYRFWITALTAGLGAILFGAAVGLPVVVWLLLFVLGIVIQYALARASGRVDAVRPGYPRSAM